MAMEALWADLSQDELSVASPAWTRQQFKTHRTGRGN